MPTHDLCAYCKGSGTITLPRYAGVEKCPQCNGTGVKLISREEEKERRRQERLSRVRRDPYLGTADRLERNFMKIGLGVLIVWILFVFALIGALIALIIHFV